MNILLYVWSLSNGGAERVASLWARGFAEQKHTVTVMLGSFSSRYDYKLLDNTKVIRQSIVYSLWKKILPPKIAALFFSSKYCDFAYNVLPEKIKNWFTSLRIKKIKPDVIIVVQPGMFNRIRGALDLCNFDIPIIVTDHNAYERPDYAKFTDAQYYQKFTASYSYDFLTVLTEADKKVLKEKTDESFMKKVYVLPNPLTFDPLKEVPSKENVVFAAGRMEIWHCKGFDLLLKAWSEIQKKFPSWMLKIAGGGDTSPLVKMCSELGISNRVEFLGFVDVKKQFEKASVFVLSSRYEGFGMVLTEAMSQGCACIACDYKGRQREIILDSKQGIVCPTDDVDAIKDALEKILSDEIYRKQLQTNAIDRSKYYELPNIMNRWNEIFKRIGIMEKSK